MAPHETTNLTLEGMIFGLAMGLLSTILPRRYAFIPLMLTACFITFGQRVDVAGLNFTMMRIVILFGWMRLFIRREIRGIELTPIDKVMIWWIMASIVTSTILIGTWDGFISSLAPAYNAAGIYFLFRFLLRDQDEVVTALLSMALIIIPVAGLMILESQTGRNLFSAFGGVPEMTRIRGDRLRCQGPFRHPIMAGTLGATSIPLFLGLWFSKKKRWIAITGLVSAVVIMITSSSSGPLMTALAGFVGILLWPFRNYMKAIWWGFFLGIIGLHMVMKAPVWYLIGRLSHLVGGTGWHRSDLIDVAIKNFGEWWLVGTTHTVHWGEKIFLPPLHSDPNNIDITNQYIFIGVNGGLLPLILFILVIAYCFIGIGNAISKWDKRSLDFKKLFWAMGAALFSHAVSFLAVSYFDQILVYFYMLLAMIATVSSKSVLPPGAQINSSVYKT